MVSVKVTITRVTDETFPGWVEAELIDGYGKRHIFHNKSPIFEADADCRLAELPRIGAIRCTVVERQSALVIIDTV